MLPRRTSALRGQLLLSTFAIALIAAPVAAQETDRGVFQMLGRIIFGAGTAKVAIDTPQAVTSIDRADLDRDQPRTISEMLKTVPGVQGTGASARPIGQAFNIRGIGNADQAASETRIAVTVDGAPKFFEAYRMGSFFGDLDLYKRVEILRGPASSTLYGAGAIGGAIAFTTKDPSDYLTEDQNNALRIKVGYEGNGNTLNLGATWAKRIGNMEVLGNLHRSEGDDVQDGHGDDIPGTAHKSTSGLVKAIWHLGNDDDQTLTFSASRTDTNLDDTLVTQSGELQFRGPIPSSSLNDFGRADLAATDDTVALKWHNAAASNPLLDLTVQLSYTDTRLKKSDFSLASFCGPRDNTLYCDSTFAYSTTALKIENVADLSMGNWKNLVTVGVQLSTQDRTAQSTAGSMPFHPEGRDRKAGLYAQGEFTWNEKLTLIPGIRLDFGNFSPSEVAKANGGTSRSETAISPKLAALYKVTDNFSVFGSIAHTERMPSLDELYQYNPVAGRVPVRVTSTGLKKEEADTIELGFAWQKQNLLSDGDSLQLKLTAFHNDVTNKIVTTPTSVRDPNTPYYQNLAAAEIWGAELELGYDAAHWFSQLAYSNIRSKDKTAGSTTYGVTLPDTPAEHVVLTLGAKLPEQNLVIGVRGNWFDDITTSSLATSSVSYNTQDIFVTWSPDKGVMAGLDVNFAVENITDAYYRNNLQLDNGMGRNAKLSITKSVLW